MKVREYKALAREILIGRYGTIIVAGILSVLLRILTCVISLAGLATALYCSGLAADAEFLSMIPGKGLSAAASGAAAAAELASRSLGEGLLTVLGVLVFTAFLFLTIVFCVFFTIGRQKLLLNICRGEKYGVGDIFYAFKAGTHPWRVVLATIVRFLIHNLIGVVPAVVVTVATVVGPGLEDLLASRPWAAAVIGSLVVFGLVQIWVDLGLHFTELSIIDKPERSIGDALKHSMKVMKHKRLKLIWMLIFSFLFWYLLMAVCHFTSLWIMPYIEASMIILYLHGDDSIWQVEANRFRSTAAKHNEEAPAAPAAAAAAPAAIAAAAAPAEEVKAEAAPSQEEVIAGAAPTQEVAAEAVPAQETAESVPTAEEEIPEPAEPLTDEAAQEPAAEEAGSVHEEMTEAAPAEEMPAEEAVPEAGPAEETQNNGSEFRFPWENYDWNQRVQMEQQNTAAEDMTGAPAETLSDYTAEGAAEAAGDIVAAAPASALPEEAPETAEEEVFP